MIFNTSGLDFYIIQEGLLILLIVCLLIQLFYLLVYHRKLSVYAISTESPVGDIPVSVIISARNESANLSSFLPSVLEQDYPQFEVVVVNDCSYDNSEEILEEFQKKYSNLKLVTVTERRFKTGKKFALTMGIKAAAYENLLFTDADCYPVSANWITRMAANFSEPEKQIILGYSPYKRKAGLLNALIRFETIKTAINYLSAALRGKAYMGVGRNLAYTKSLFFANKGFASHMHVMSGDDDLFVNENATTVNTAIEIHPDSFTLSEPKSTFASWFRQKKRHMGAGKLYKGAHKRMLTIEALSGVLFYLSLITILCLGYNIQLLLALGLFLLRWIIQLVVFNKSFKRLKGKDLLWYLPIIDLVYYVYLVIFGMVGTFIKTTQWK